MQKGFLGAAAYLGMSYLLGLLGQLGREHAKDIAYGHNRYTQDRDRNHSRKYGFGPPKRTRREFMPEIGKVHGRQEGSTESSRPRH